MKQALYLLPYVLFGIIVQASGGEDRPSEVERIRDLIHEAEMGIVAIDDRLSAIEQGQTALHAEAREAHRAGFETRQRIANEDEDMLELIATIEALQVEIHQRQEELTRMMSEHPDYMEAHDRQRKSIQRATGYQQESMQLADERVLLQQRIHALELHLEEALAADDEAQAGYNEGVHRSAEDFGDL